MEEKNKLIQPVRQQLQVIQPASGPGMAQAVNEMPAEFFVNTIIKGVEKLEEQTGQPSMPREAETEFKVLEDVFIDEEDRTHSNGLKCPIAGCGYRTYSSIKTAWRSAFRTHFKKYHPDQRPVF
jgi:hypothetical protein